MCRCATRWGLSPRSCLLEVQDLAILKDGLHSNSYRLEAGNDLLGMTAFAGRGSEEICRGLSWLLTTTWLMK